MALKLVKQMHSLTETKCERFFALPFLATYPRLGWRCINVYGLVSHRGSLYQIYGFPLCSIAFMRLLVGLPASHCLSVCQWVSSFLYLSICRTVCLWVCVGMSRRVSQIRGRGNLASQTICLSFNEKFFLFFWHVYEDSAKDFIHYPFLFS